jgi:hypothetical protein
MNNTNSRTTPQNSKLSLIKYRNNWLKQVFLDPDLTPAVKVVAAYTALYLNNDTWMAWPSVRRMHRETTLARSTIQDAIKRLEDQGHWKIHRTHYGSRMQYKYEPVLKTDLAPRASDGACIDGETNQFW